jgi:hypothetical protein
MVGSSSSSSAASSAEAWAHIGEAVGPVVDRPELAPLLDKVRERAYMITGRDVEGVSADELYEAVLPVAFVVADEKLRAALEAIDAH